MGDCSDNKVQISHDRGQTHQYRALLTKVQTGPPTPCPGLCCTTKALGLLSSAGAKGEEQQQAALDGAEQVLGVGQAAPLPHGREGGLVPLQLASLLVTHAQALPATGSAPPQLGDGAEGAAGYKLYGHQGSRKMPGQACLP